MPPRVLITGGSGFIGQHIAEKFLREGRAVTIFDVKEPNRPALRKHFVQGDALDLAAVRHALRGEPDIIHLVGLADFGVAQKDPHRSFVLNVQSLETMLEACRLGSARKIVFPSSAAVYGTTEDLPIRERAPVQPTNIYSWHKVVCEDLLRGYAANYGIPHVTLRLFNVYGMENKGVIDYFLAKAKKGEAIHSFGARQYRDFVYAGDVADAMYRAIVYDKATNRVVNIGSGHGTQIREILDLVCDLVPGAKWTEKKAEFSMYDSIADISLARILLDFRPRAGLEAIRDVIRKEML